MDVREANEVLQEVVRFVRGRPAKPSKAKPKHKGKTISFAELDGPFTTGPGGRGDFEQGQYVIVYHDSKDNEIGSIGYRSYQQAKKKLAGLEKAGVEVSLLSGGAG